MKRAELLQVIRFAIDTERQVMDGRLLLSLLDVEQVAGEGVIGFDGAAEEARRVKRPAKRAATDPLGWWDLSHGVYLVTYNERLEIPDGYGFWLQPHAGIMSNGLWHPTLLVTDWDREAVPIMLTVSARGVRLFENAVITTAIPLKL